MRCVRGCGTTFDAQGRSAGRSPARSQPCRLVHINISLSPNSELGLFGFFLLTERPCFRGQKEIAVVQRYRLVNQRKPLF